MTPDDIALSAYLDNELPEDEADRLTVRLAADPALLRRREAMRGGDRATRQLFARIDKMPLPQAVLDLLAAPGAASGKVLPFPVRAVRQFLQVPVAIAASVALLAGFLASDLLRTAATSGANVTAIVAGNVDAGSELHGLLESGVSSEPETLTGGVQGRLLLTFQDNAGDYCRQLRLASTARAVQALACRRSGQWQIETLDFAAATPDGQYQQAAQGGSAAVNAAVDALIGKNEPLDAAAESRLVRNGWKNIAE
jgi:negative regulator of sigma E activity